MSFRIGPTLSCDYPGCIADMAIVSPPDPEGDLTLSTAYQEGWRRTVVNPDEGNSLGLDYCPEHATLTLDNVASAMSDTDNGSGGHGA